MMFEMTLLTFKVTFIYFELKKERCKVNLLVAVFFSFLSGDKSISTPMVDATLGDVAGKRRHRKVHKSASPTKRRPWSSDEEEQLKLGINRYGVGKWAEINMGLHFPQQDKCAAER